MPSLRLAWHARCSEKNKRAFIACNAISVSQVFAAGALVSNVDDMARWENAVASGKLISAENYRNAFTPYVLTDGSACAYGYGWEIGMLQQRPMLAHSGGINGFMTCASGVMQTSCSCCAPAATSRKCISIAPMVFIKNTLVHLEFLRDEAGAVVKVVLHQHGEANDNPRMTDYFGGNR